MTVGTLPRQQDLPAPRSRPWLWWVMVLLALPIVAHSWTYILGPSHFGPRFRTSFLEHPWVIIAHSFFGPLALGFGPFQFVPSIRDTHPRLHRIMGRTYVVSSLVTGAAGLYLAVYSFGGMVSHLGFGTLALALIGTTVVAYRRALHRDFVHHRQWMLRSYSLIYASVTLRILLPLLVVLQAGQFQPAYRMVAWLCWIPNVVLAEWWIRRSAD